MQAGAAPMPPHMELEARGSFTAFPREVRRTEGGDPAQKKNQLFSLAPLGGWVPFPAAIAAPGEGSGASFPVLPLGQRATQR